VNLLKMLLVAGLVLGVAGMAAAQDAKPKEAPKPKSLHGVLTKVDGKNLLVKVKGKKGEADKDVTVATDEKTKFLVDYEEGKLEDLKAEMTVTATPDTGTATEVKAHVKGAFGSVVKVEGKNLVIKSTAKDKKEITVATDEKTRVVIDGKPAKLEDLKPGMKVKAIPETGTATKIATTSTPKDAGKTGGEKAAQK